MRPLNGLTTARLFRQVAPQGLPRINWRNPLTKGLKACFVTLPSGVIVDAVMLSRGIASPTGVQRGKFGIAGSGSFSAGITSDLNWTSGPFSAAVSFNILSGQAANYVGMFSRQSYTNESVNQGWACNWRPSTDFGKGWAFVICNNNSVGSYATTHSGDTSYVAGGHVLGFSGDGTANNNLYVDGINKCHATTGNFVPASASASTSLGGSGSVYTYIACTWNRVLAASEHVSFAADARQFLIYPNSALPWLVGAAAGGGGVTLSGKTHYVMGGRASRTGAASLRGIEKSGVIGRVPIRGAASLIGRERSQVRASGSRTGKASIAGRLLTEFRARGSRTGVAALSARAKSALTARPRIVSGLIALLARSAMKFSGRASRVGTGPLNGRGLTAASGKGSRVGIGSLRGRASSHFAGRGRFVSGLIGLLARSATMFSGRASRVGKASLHGQSRSRLAMAVRGLFSRQLSARSLYRVTQKGNVVRMVPLRANMMTLTYARGSRTGTASLKATSRSMWRSLLASLLPTSRKIEESVVVPAQHFDAVVPAQHFDSVIQPRSR